MADDTRIWIHNLRLLYGVVSHASPEDYSVSATRKWVGLVTIPGDMTRFEAIHHPDLSEAEIIGGNPLIAAFTDVDDYVLAMLRFS